MTAETEGIGERDIDVSGATDVGDIIEIATLFWMFEIDCGRDNPVVDGEGRGYAFDAACAAEEVSSHRFGGTDGDFVGMVAEGFFNGSGFGRIVDGGAGAVSINIADGFWCESSIFETEGHCTSGIDTAGGLSGHVISIAGHGVADDFGIDFRAAIDSVFEFFEDQDTGAFAHDEPIASGIERTTSMERVIVASGDSFTSGKSGNS